MTRFSPLLVVLLLSGCAEMVTDIFEYGSVEVTAVRRNGDPVPGVELTLFSSFQVMAQGITDEEGRFLFEFVPPNYYGVHAEPPEGYVRPEDVIGGPSTAYVQNILMEAGTEAEASFTYAKRGPGRIEVSVREPDGAPVEGTEVHLTAPDQELGKLMVGPTGVVAFDVVSFGARRVWLLPPGVFLDFGEDLPGRGGILVEEGSDDRVEFVLERCLGTVRAEVQDPSGDPAKGVSLRVFDPGQDVAFGESGSDGEAAFQSLQCKDYGIALLPSPGWAFSQGRGLSYQDGIHVGRDSDQRFSFTVRRCAGEVRVRVTDPGGVVVEGAALELYTATRSLVQGLTADDGLHSFSDAPCDLDFGLRLNPGVGYLINDGPGAGYFDGLSIGDGEVQDYAFVVNRCSQEIRVRVEDQAGNPVQGAGLELFSTPGTLAAGVSGADGNYTFSSFVCGLEYGVKVEAPAGYTVVQGRGFSFFDGISLDPDEQLQLTFRLTGTLP